MFWGTDQYLHSPLDIRDIGYLIVYVNVPYLYFFNAYILNFYIKYLIIKIIFSQSENE